LAADLNKKFSFLAPLGAGVSVYPRSPINLLQAGAIRRRFSQAAKKSLSQRL